MKKYKCQLCGVTFEVKDDEEPICPVCGVGIENLDLVEEEKKPTTKEEK